MRLCVKYGMSIPEFYKSTDRELYVFINARSEALKEQRDFDRDMTRRIMWASIQVQTEKTIKLSDLIRLDSDSDRKDLTDYENQELKKWNKMADEGPRAIIPD